MSLAEVSAKNAKAANRDYKLFDEKGLYLRVKINRAKYWRVKCRFARKEKTLSLGVYPEISLKKARLDRDEASLQLSYAEAAGIIDSDPTRALKGVGAIRPVMEP